MTYYHAVVHKDADSAFGVHFPGLAGCFSAADDFDDLLPNAIEALALYFEGEAVIAPPSLATVRVAATGDLAEGAFLVAVPYVRPSGQTTRINVSLDRGVLEAIDAAAAQRKLTRSAFLVEAARAAILSDKAA